MVEAFLFLTYVLGTGMGLWFANQKIRTAVENTVDQFVQIDNQDVA